MQIDTSVPIRIIGICREKWINLDILLEQVEKGEFDENVLLFNETFLRILAAVKQDKSNYKKIPDFIRNSKLTEKYCKQVNPELKEPYTAWHFDASQKDVVDSFREYLGLLSKKGV